MINEVLLSVNDFGLTFQSAPKEKPTLEHVSFTLQMGETVALVGESGSGKSVTAMSLLGLVPAKAVRASEGSYSFAKGFFENVETIRVGSEQLHELRGKKVGVVFQEPMTALNPVMRVGDQVAEAIEQNLALSKAQTTERVLRLFHEVRLPEPERLFYKYPHELSGGQRQRVMIALAISCEPQLLIADEPTTALDVTVQAAVLDLLKELQMKTKMGLLFITHDLGVVAQIADRIVVMKDGRTVEQGSIKKVLQNPEHPYTKGLMACRPKPGQKAFSLLTVDDVINGRTVVPRKWGLEENQDVLVRVDQLSKKYTVESGVFNKERRDFFAVNEVSFSIKKGETLGLVGESGCGKTTLSRMMLGLIPPSSGSIELMGKPVQHLKSSEWKDIRKEVQIVFQDPYSSLNPKMTIGEAIMEPMRVYGLHTNETGRRRKMEELLEHVGLSNAAAVRYPHEFSGGQRQRVVIARALSVQPSFVICDEAVAALDVSVQAQVLNLLNALKVDFGLTYLFISHDLNVVYYMSDRIMVMNKGRVEELGRADDVFFQPQSAYTKSLLASIPGGIQ
jgi:peptide/nickel transport system ATP-binding protein